jgi:hypothetical protein
VGTELWIIVSNTLEVRLVVLEFILIIGVTNVTLKGQGRGRCQKKLTSSY